MSFDAPAGRLDVEATFAKGMAGHLRVDKGADPFVQHPEFRADGSDAFVPFTKRGTSFDAPPCEKRSCTVRYRYALRDAAKKLDDLDVASEEGDGIEAPPSTWLLFPILEPADAGRRHVRFRVKASEGSRFVTGVFPSREANDAWDISIDDLATSPYSAFGTFRGRTLDIGGAKVEVEVAPGSLAISDEDFFAWVAKSATAVRTYFGTFPMRHALVLVVTSRGRWVGGGRTLSGGGGTVFLRVGRSADSAAFREDWVLVHEMVHLSFPSVPRGQTWAEEGLATYVEPFARVRAGQLSEEQAWAGLVEGLPNGLPRAGDHGLDHTPTWGRTYWGGALFFLLADVKINERTKGTKGLDTALQAIVREAGTAAARRPLEETLDIGDRAIGATVLRELHDAMKASPHPVDLDALFKSLGVRVADGSAEFDDAAPLAHVRRAIARGR